MNNVLNQNGTVLEETLAFSNSDAVKTTLRGLLNFVMTFHLWQVLENLSTFLCLFVIYKREYYEWLSRLRRHIQIGRLPVQTP